MVWTGDKDFYGFEDLRKGDDGKEKLPFLVGLGLTHTLQLPFVDMNNGHAAHIDIIPGSDYCCIILIDATEQRNQQRQLQQKANELKLLTYRQERLMKALRAARDDLAVKRRQAEEANLAKGRFISGMSHEFRTPLTSIMGYVDLLRKRPGTSKVCLDYLAAIERGARHLLSLIENVLDQARLEAEELVISPTPTDLLSLTQDLSLIFKSLAAQEDLAFNLEPKSRLPNTVLLDNVRFRQVLINLIGNALKFTKKGHVSLELNWHDDWLSAAVVDTGPGIPEKQLENIFQPFKRTNTLEKEGAGLGLAISKQLAELMGGVLTVKSTLNVGSRFDLLIPAKYIDRQTPADEVQGSKHAIPGVSDRGNILLAEDNDDIIQLVELFLTDAGYQLMTATDGAQAVELALKSKPDLMFMDLDLPVLDGLKATAQLRSAGFNRPIIALTASPSAGNKQQAIDAGCNEYLLKPMDMSHLLDVIRAFMDK
jgi:signal transduction histidine kinase/CheY-like chemotaxis protein